MTPAETGTVTGAMAPSRPERAKHGVVFPVRPNLRQPAPNLGPRANRTIARIVEATKEIFLARGYDGTTVDEITRAAGISRASFYTYFPSKRDVLLLLGANTAHEVTESFEALGALGERWTPEQVGAWVVDYYALLDQHGSFAHAWTQAANADTEIREAGMRRHLETCRHLGTALGLLRGEPFPDAREQGLVVASMLERAWLYTRLYRPAISETAMIEAASFTIVSLVQTR